MASTGDVHCVWLLDLRFPLRVKLQPGLAKTVFLHQGCVCVCVFVRVCVSYSQGWPKPYSCTRDVCVFVCVSLTARVGQNRILAPGMCVFVRVCVFVCLIARAGQNRTNAPNIMLLPLMSLFLTVSIASTIINHYRQGPTQLCVSSS